MTQPVERKYNGYWLSLICDDVSTTWHAQISDRDGDVLHETEDTPQMQGAERDAIAWINAQNE
jgi:hypothetical protein